MAEHIRSQDDREGCKSVMRKEAFDGELMNVLEHSDNDVYMGSIPREINNPPRALPDVSMLPIQSNC